ncbi:MAG: alpha-mannosidase [Clostridia bacterium]|nr:alpha-mannosidase [Clostridia bacterium]
MSIYLIGNAHIDPVWLWRWQEGFVEIKATFRSVLDRMKEFDDFKFTCACASYYEWIEKNEPAMFEEIKQRIQEGRWQVVGGWYLQPDCNIPCGESFARHALISQRYFKEKFGVTATVGYNVDSFGHNGNLPQILQNGGLSKYVFLRPMEHEKSMANSLFTWQGVDGSTVEAFRIPVSYGICERTLDLLDQVEEQAKKEDIDCMAFYGIGNHGGGPSIRLLETLHTDRYKEHIFSTPEEYFEAVKDVEKPVLSGDLQHHARGCYTACSEIKHNNRLCENNLLAAESFSVLAGELCDVEYPSERLTTAWKNTLFNQFHDILGGCSIKRAYQDASYLHGEAMSITEQAINFAMQKISWNIDTLGDWKLPCRKQPNFMGGRVWMTETDGPGTPIVVFNPLPFATKQVLPLSVLAIGATDENGTAIPIQKIRAERTNGDKDLFVTAIQVEVPAFGYKTYRVFVPEEETEIVNETGFVCTDSSVESDLLKIRFGENGGLCSIFDKEDGKELLKGETYLGLYDEEHCDTWAHNVDAFDKEVDRFRFVGMKTIENGKLRCVTEVTYKTEQSMAKLYYTIEKGSKKLSIRAVVDFHEKHKMLKLKVPFGINYKESVCEIPYGFIKREADAKEQPCGKWVAVFDENGGAVIANDGKYGYDADENTVGISLLRGAIYADHYGVRDDLCEFMEQGFHEFELTVAPCRNTTEASRIAYELNMPLRYLNETFHKGSLKTEFSGLSVSAENIMVSAIKTSEDGEGLVIRAYETENKSTRAELNLFGKKVSATFAPGEIKTFKMCDNAIINETNFVEM